MIEQYCWGRLRINNWGKLELELALPCRPYDHKLGDRIASIEYDDAEAAMRDLGYASVELAILQGEAHASGYVTYNGGFWEGK